MSSSSQYRAVWPALGTPAGNLVGKLPAIVQGSLDTLTIQSLYSDGTAIDLTGETITGIAVLQHTGAVYALSGTFTGGDGTFTWALSAGDRKSVV